MKQRVLDTYMWQLFVLQSAKIAREQPSEKGTTADYDNHLYAEYKDELHDIFTDKKIKKKFFTQMNIFAKDGSLANYQTRFMNARKTDRGRSVACETFKRSRGRKVIIGS